MELEQDLQKSGPDGPVVGFRTLKVFISQPMAGFTDAQILEKRNQLIQIIKSKFDKFNIEVIDSFEKSEEIVGAGRIAMLGHSIMLMKDADIVFFARNWRKSAGCCVEHEVCVQYKIRRLYEDVIEDLIAIERDTQGESNGVYWR